MIRRPPRSTRTDTLFPYTTLFRSISGDCSTLDAGRSDPDLQPGGVARLRPAADNEHHRARCRRSEEHTSELQSLMRISYAVFCLKKKKKRELITHHKEQLYQLCTKTIRLTYSIQ